jgi:hypothetical protein
MKARIEHLVGQGLAKRQGEQVIFVRDLLDTLADASSRKRQPARVKVQAEFIVGQPRISRSWVPIGSDLTLPQGVSR